MRKINNNDLKVYNDIFKLCEEEDIEFIEAISLDVSTSDRLDAINILTFRIFNDIITFSKEEQDKLIKKIKLLDDIEFAFFRTEFISDILIVTSYI